MQPPFPGLQNLVMVAGHSVYTSPDLAHPDSNDRWFLEAYQMVPGQAHSFLEHIQLGILTVRLIASHRQGSGSTLL